MTEESHQAIVVINGRDALIECTSTAAHELANGTWHVTFSV